MVTSVTSYSGNGLKDWILQRATAVFLAFYIVFLLLYCMLHKNLSYGQWHGLFSLLSMKIFSLLAIINLVIHAWIGIWTVLTDYIKCAVLSLCFYAAVVLALLVYLIWAIEILWGV